MTPRVGRFTTVVLLILLATPYRVEAWFQFTDGDVGMAWRVGLAVSMLLLVCSVVDTYVARRRMPPDLRRVGEEFVNAFAKPLLDPASAAAPVRARLRFVPELRQLDVLIAPDAGRKYPNLSDHKRNVEYDVDRVARLLGERLVVSDRLRAEGKWVVIPIRLADSKEAGVK